MKKIKDLKIKDSKDLAKLDPSKLIEEVKGAEKNLYVLKMKLAMGELKQTHLVKPLRRYIANVKSRITTVK